MLLQLCLTHLFCGISELPLTVTKENDGNYIKDPYCRVEAMILSSDYIIMHNTLYLLSIKIQDVYSYSDCTSTLEMGLLGDCLTEIVIIHTLYNN